MALGRRILQPQEILDLLLVSSTKSFRDMFYLAFLAPVFIFLLSFPPFPPPPSLPRCSDLILPLPSPPLPDLYLFNPPSYRISSHDPEHFFSSFRSSWLSAQTLFGTPTTQTSSGSEIMRRQFPA